MTSEQILKRIKNYAVISFLVPLLAINSCLLLYKFFWSVQHNDFVIYPNFNWNKTEHVYNFEKYNKLINDTETYTFTNCPKYELTTVYTSNENKNILYTHENKILIDSLIKSNKIKNITFKNNEILNYKCIKNYQSAYSLFKKFNWLETLYVNIVNTNPTGFSKVINPYFYGEVSISRTARYFPATWIFKPLIILSAIFLLLYWINNLNFFNLLKKKNILNKFSKKFFYFGIFSCIFLILHATFLGLNIESDLFTKLRRAIIILFILFEISAQLLLTKSLFLFKDKLKNYINPLILKTKIIFVIIVFFASLISLIILTFGDPSTAFKLTLEWNYFSFLLVYYLLSRLLWK